MVARDMTTGPSAALPASLKMTVTQADATNAYGLRNRGWWGVPLRANTAYTGSLYAKGDAAGIAAGITISLVANNTGKVLAAAKLATLTADWKQYSFTLKTGPGVPGERRQPDCRERGSSGNGVAAIAERVSADLQESSKMVIAPT